MTQILIRPSNPEDLAALTAIFGWHVRHGTRWKVERWLSVVMQRHLGPGAATAPA